MCKYDQNCFFKDTPPIVGVSAHPVPVHVSAEVIHQMLTEYCEVVQHTHYDAEHDESRIPTHIEDMWVKSVTTGYGSFTSHHLNDSDYIVDFYVIRSDSARICEVVYGVHNGKIACWMD